MRIVHCLELPVHLQKSCDWLTLNQNHNHQCIASLLGNPSCLSAGGVVGNCVRVCWRAISNVVVIATGLNLSPCGTPTVDLKGLSITFLTRTLRLVFDSSVVAICTMSSLLSHAN